MSLKIKKYIILGASVLSFAILIFLQYGNSAVKTSNAVLSAELRPDGFYPKDITINKGDTVTFSTTRGTYFWPASNLHPTHTIYPEFDPKEPIDADKTWSFKFDKVGTWNYHDHLAPLYTGRVTVVDGNRVLGTSCEKSAANKLQCWETTMDSVLKKNDIDAGFDLVQRWYETEPTFQPSCHSFMHKLGASAYWIYARNEKIDLTAKTSYCGYGFYHGFMETLLTATGSFEKAREFCLSAGQKLISETQKPVIACFHGIGHGTVDGSDPRAWGDEDAIIAPGLNLCEKVGYNDKEKNLCATGVYNALSIAYGGKLYGLEGDKNDPYAACRKQSKSYFEDACYEEMNTNAMRMANGDFSKTIKFAEDIKDDYLAKVAAENMSAVAASQVISTRNYDKAILVCQETQERLRLPCISGLIGGVLETGRPGSEYIDGIDFCNSEALDTTSREKCFNGLVSNSTVLYPQKVVSEICSKIDIKYRTYCPKQ